MENCCKKGPLVSRKRWPELAGPTTQNLPGLTWAVLWQCSWQHEDMRGAILRRVGRSVGTASQLAEGPPTTEGQLIHLGNQTAETPRKPPSPAVIASLTLLSLSVSIITTLPSYPNLSPGFLLGSPDCTPSPQQFVLHAATRGIVADANFITFP